MLIRCLPVMRIPPTVSFGFWNSELAIPVSLLPGFTINVFRNGVQVLSQALVTLACSKSKTPMDTSVDESRVGTHEQGRFTLVLRVGLAGSHYGRMLH